ncbi:glycosyltransferase family 4 protein [Photorhabdus tasmaniensis]|uniref:Glycosyl transferase family 1 n=1 Tax=Photorhabdus tasmaniensis TaxID=1004159 RepID=A0ABX0GFQ4_9GAMM|nr:glycosyltransferase family 4 protein [Photorhabdus tasmaniensis]NHB87616.1 glycosyl transferase family 1 [Photorhabdus tasmaniensis]
MKSVRLAIVRQKYRSDGGAERFVSRALAALGNENLELNVITRSWQGDISPDWCVHLANPHKWGRISRERGFAKAARAVWEKEQFDLVQSHERIAGCDIYRAGDGVHQRWLQQRARVLSSWRGKLLFASRYHRYVMDAEQKMYSAPELKMVICNSEMVKREVMADFGLSEKKIAVIYNAINHNQFFPAIESQRMLLRKEYDLPRQAKCFVYVGSGFERKGLKVAIQAVSATDAYLIVVGQDKEEKKYKQLANSLGCNERIRFMGMQKKTLPFYQIADGLLLPTLYDPFPNVILEAMACGLPVITSTTCGGAEFVTSGSNGFICDALDIRDITEAIQNTPSDHLNNKMSELARTKVLPYTPEHLSQQLIGLYERVLSS